MNSHTIKKIQAKQAEIRQYEFDLETLRIMQRSAKRKYRAAAQNGADTAEQIELYITEFALSGLINRVERGII